MGATVTTSKKVAAFRRAASNFLLRPMNAIDLLNERRAEPHVLGLTGAKESSAHQQLLFRSHAHVRRHLATLHPTNFGENSCSTNCL